MDENITNIFISNIVSRDEIGLWYWFWIFPCLYIAHILIEYKCNTQMTNYLGRSIEIQEFYKGPKLAEPEENQDENEENEENVALTVNETNPVISVEDTNSQANNENPEEEHQV